VSLCSCSRSAAPFMRSETHVPFLQQYHTCFDDIGCPQRRVVVLRHVAGDAADFQSVTFSAVPARGIKECIISSVEFNDSHLSGLVGCAPLLSCYDFHGLAHMQDIHGDGKVYIHL